MVVEPSKEEKRLIKLIVEWLRAESCTLRTNMRVAGKRGEWYIAADFRSQAAGMDSAIEVVRNRLWANR